MERVSTPMMTRPRRHVPACTASAHGAGAILRSRAWRGFHGEPPITIGAACCRPRGRSAACCRSLCCGRCCPRRVVRESAAPTVVIRSQDQRAACKPSSPRGPDTFVAHLAQPRLPTSTVRAGTRCHHGSPRSDSSATTAVREQPDSDARWHHLHRGPRRSPPVAVGVGESLVITTGLGR